MIESLNESLEFLADAHTSLLIAHADANGRLDDSFDAALLLVQELSCEIALLKRRAIYEKGH